MRRFCVIAVLVLLMVGYGFSYRRVKDFRANLPDETKRAQALAVTPELLRIVSGPFKGVMADYLLLKASIFVGGISGTTPEDWEAVHTLFKQSLYLDPYFFQTANYIQGILVWKEGMAQKSIDLLEHHVSYRDWDWEPRFFLGFDYYYFLHDNTTAARYMREAGQLPGASMIVATLGSRLAQREGQTLTAIAILKELIEKTEEPAAVEVLVTRLKAHLGVYQLEQALSEYERLFVRKPQSLNVLVTEGIIQQLPENPYGDAFIYDHETGAVYFDSIR